MLTAAQVSARSPWAEEEMVRSHGNVGGSWYVYMRRELGR